MEWDIMVFKEAGFEIGKACGNVVLAFVCLGLFLFLVALCIVTINLV
jgi:hypothetical protein